MVPNFNGSLTTLLYYAVGKFGIAEETAIWDMSLKRIMLLLREKVFIESEHPGIQLSTMQYLDELDRGRT